MRKTATTSLSVLSSVGFMYLLLIALVVILTNQFIFSFLQDQDPLQGPVPVLSVIFIGILFLLLVFQTLRLISAVRSKEAGIRFKIRLLSFFGAIIIAASLPSTVLTGNLLRNAFDIWFVKDTNASLSFGVKTALLYYQEQYDSLKSLTSAELLPSFVRSIQRNPEEGWRRFKQALPYIDSLQVFDEAGRAIVSQGNEDLWLETENLRFLSVGQISKEQLGQYSLLRSMQWYDAEDGSGRSRLIMTIELPSDFDNGAGLISRTEYRLNTLQRFAQSFPFAVFVIYLLFLVPLVILAVLVSFYLAESLVNPLVQLEQVVNKVAQGDYTTRLLVRKNDVMAPFVASFNDMVAELERSRHELMQTERVQTWQDIAQRLAHEIKNPLTPIKLAAERILKKYKQNSADLSQSLEDGVQTIIQEVESLSAMLTEFRDFARLPQPVLEQVDLRELVDSAWQLYSGSTNAVFDNSGLSGDLKLRLDPGQFMQVFKNLFQNALDACKGREGRIWVNGFELDRMGQKIARIQVRDNGSGIAAELLSEIFNPYFTTKSTGSGLGLAICEKIVLDHGGRIWAESQVGQGTSFFIDLPLPVPKKQGS